jgi:DHA2 family multidrug resistance protein
MVSGAVAWLGCMALWRTNWTSGADFWTLALPQVVQGFAMGFFMIPLTTITLTAVEPHETASAAGLQNFLRTIAVAVSTSLVLTVWGDAQRVSRSEIVSKLNPDDVQHVLNNSGVSMEVGRQMISNIVDQEAIAMAIDHSFMLTAMVLFFAALVVWLSPRAKGVADPSVSH